MGKYDVIIIWSWLWWLSAWALLSKKWKKVLVLEKHYLLWWYSTNFKRKWYDFDVALHQIWWIEKTWFRNILEESWVLSKLKFIKHKYLYETFYPDFDLKVENWNAEKLKKDLIKIFPKEKFWINLWFFIIKYLWFQLKIWDFWWKNKLLFLLVNIFWPLLIPFLIFFDKVKISSILNICTKNEKLQKVFMELIWYYWDSLNISALYYLAPSYWYYFDWWYYVKGWWQAVSDAFISVIKENWWEVLARSWVDEIIIKWEKAIWVKVWEKEYFWDFIISNASPFILYENLLKNWNWSKNEIEKLKNFEVWPSLTAIYIWLNINVKEENKDFSDSYIISKNENYKIDFQKNDITVFTITDNEDNELIKKWTSIITIALYEKYSHRDNLSEEEYKIKKEEKKIEIINKLNIFFPNIEKYIEVFEIWTPKTMERYTWNKNWAVYWFSQNVIKWNRYWYKTPIKNLFLSSSWSFWWWFEWAIRAWYQVSKKIK